MALLVLDMILLLLLAVHGGHRWWQTATALRLRWSSRTPSDPPSVPADPPTVTIQLPMFNEQLVARRVIEAAAALEHPRDRLQIQVLDDSTDSTTEIVAETCRELAGRGIDVEHHCRSDRTGYKAGALAAGLETARGELIAIFDADFVPPPDLLQRLIGHFEEPDVGLVQARWEHLNRDECLLTRLQALFLDAHFLVEQVARAGTGRWFNFNGTAGIWRRSCIDDAGGWHADTLTEDTDLSYRAQLRGWRFVFRPDVTCPAELPPRLDAFLAQQHRWSKGLIQSARKLLPSLACADAPASRLTEAVAHLLSPLAYPVLLTLSLVAPLSLVVPMPDGPEWSRAWTAVTVFGWLCLSAGTLGACAHVLAAQAVRPGGVRRALPLLPVLLALGIGLALINTRAVVEAWLGRSSPFLRTPKFGGRRADPDDAETAAIRRRLVPAGAFELVLGLLMAACLVMRGLGHPNLVGWPFLVLFAAGFTWIGIAGLVRPRPLLPVADRPPATRATSPEPTCDSAPPRREKPAGVR